MDKESKVQKVNLSLYLIRWNTTNACGIIEVQFPKFVISAPYAIYWLVHFLIALYSGDGGTDSALVSMDQ